MQLSIGAREVITQAQNLRLQTNGDELCVEHIFYGLLLMSCYLDVPMNKPEYREEAIKLRSFLEQKMCSIASAVYQLKNDAETNSERFVNATSMLGRASELAETGEIGVMELARAAWETATPVIRSLQWEQKDAFREEDKKYQEAPSKKSNGITPSQFAEFLALIAVANDLQKAGLQHNTGKRNSKDKRRTKLGLFTYRGGTVAAAIQYFLFGLFVPFALLIGLEMATGAVGAPPSPFVAFLFNVYIVLWVFYLCRGVVLLFGLANDAFGTFSGIISWLALIAALTLSIQEAWSLPSVPVWIRVLSTVSALVILLVGAAMFEYLKSEKDAAKVKVDFGKMHGTPGKIFFKKLTKCLIAPLIIFAVIWIAGIDLPLWGVRLCWIAGFIWFWGVFQYIFVCLKLWIESSSRHRGIRIVSFFHPAYVYLFVPAFVLLLHRLYSWGPMRIWVIVLLSIYIGVTMCLSLAYAVRQS